MHTYIHSFIHIFLHIYMHTNIHTCMHVCCHTHTHLIRTHNSALAVLSPPAPLPAIPADPERDARHAPCLRMALPTHQPLSPLPSKRSCNQLASVNTAAAAPRGSAFRNPRLLRGLGAEINLAGALRLPPAAAGGRPASSLTAALSVAGRESR